MNNIDGNTVSKDDYMDRYKVAIIQELRNGPKLRFELVKILIEEKKVMSAKKLEKTLAELEDEGKIIRKPTELPGSRKYTSLYSLIEDEELLAEYKPKRIGKIVGRKPTTLEGSLKRAIPKLKSKLKRNPTKEEIAIEVGKIPKEIEKSLFKLAKQLKWSPPKRDIKIKKDEYSIHSKKNEHMNKDTIKVLRDFDFKSFKTLKINVKTYWAIYPREFKTLASIKDINLIKLGFPRTYRFLIDFLEESWNKRSGVIFRAKHDSDNYHDPKFNNIWIEISYGRFRESSLKSDYFGVPLGHTLIPITPTLKYYGPDKNALILRNIDQDLLSTLNYVPFWNKDRRLSNEAIRDQLFILKELEEYPIRIRDFIIREAGFNSNHVALSYEKDGKKNRSQQI